MNSRIFPLFLIGFVLGAGAEETDIRRDATVNAVEQVMPTVVNIATKQKVRVRNPIEQLRRQMSGQQMFDEFISQGSGVVIDENGYLLTNEHVIEDAEEIQVRFGTGTNIYGATVVRSDEKTDVALLKLNGKPGEKYRAIKLAREDDLLLGETVLALGNPVGLGGSVTRGILSSKSRIAPQEGAQLDIPNYLQTDAPINPGNSGGPLVNLRGELIGINVKVLTATRSGEPVQGIGFAIPIRLVEQALAEIFPSEYVKSYWWFGARVKVGSYPLVITSVQPESPAGKAGLKTGDVVMQVNGKVPRTFIDFNDLLATNATTKFPITIRRSDTVSDINVRMVPEETVFNPKMIREKLGLTLQESPYGYVITEVQPDSPAAVSGLKPQMIIQAIDMQTPPENVAEVAKLLYAKKKGEAVSLDLAALEQTGNFMRVHRGRVELVPRG
jgi:S1-C subfamily serine protease